MTTDEQERSEQARLEARIRQEMEDLPEEVAERLALMRRQAVQSLEEERPYSWTRGWMPLTASVAGAAFAVVFTLWLVMRPAGDMELPLASEPEAAIVADMELLQELEFIAWLEEESQGAG